MNKPESDLTKNYDGSREVINIKSAFKKLPIIFFINLIGRALGAFREIIVAHKFGTGMGYDVVTFIIEIGNLFSALLTISIPIVLIPILNQCFVTGQVKLKNENTSALVNFVSLLTLFIGSMMILFPEFIIRVLGPGMDKGLVLQVKKLLWMMFPFLFLKGLGYIARSVLNANQKLYYPVSSFFL